MSTSTRSSTSTTVNKQDYGLKKRPWRIHLTPFSSYLEHKYPGEGTAEAPFVVTWLPQDAENPMTWAQSRKWIITAMVAIATLAVSLASSALSAAEESIERDFPGYKTQAYVMVTSGFVLGFVVGPLLWAPLSEVFGRRKLFIFTYILFTVFDGAVVGSQNIWTLAILRFFAGTAGSSPLTNAGGTVADLFSARQRGLGMAVFASAPFLGPALGPIIGGFLGAAGGWRWVAGFLTIFCFVLTIVGTLFIPETYAPVLLRDRAERLSKATGKVYRSTYEKEKKIEVKELFSVAIRRPWILLFREPIVLLLSMYMAVVYGTLYMLFGAFPIVFQQERGWSPGIGGLAFLGVMVGVICAVLYVAIYENPRYTKRLAEEGFLAPEQRLYPAIIGAVCLPAGLFGFAWTAAPASIHWSACIILTVPFGFGMVLVFLSIFNYLIDSYLLYAASVLAANSVLRSLFGVAFPLFVVEMYHNLGINWATSLVGFLALAFAPAPLISFKYGRTIRLKSKFAREADEMGEKMRAAAMEARQKERGEKVGEEV